MLSTEQLKTLIETSIHGLTDERALELIGVVIDESGYAQLQEGLKHALSQLDEFDSRSTTPAHAALSQYFRSNAHSSISDINHGPNCNNWSCPDQKLQLLTLSRAANHAGFPDLDAMRQAQILTNYGNLLFSVGRYNDAIKQLDKALKIEPNLAKARGWRGLGLKEFAQLQTVPFHFEVIGQHAFDALMSALAPPAYYESDDGAHANYTFLLAASKIKSELLVDEIRDQNYLLQGDLGRSKAERAYRAWCLENCLMLNPLNDLGPHVAAAHDGLHVDSVSEDVRQLRNAEHMPPYFGYFNQLKQEYASARFMLYEGATSKGVHFSDRQVKLLETNDFSEFSLATERIRTAYRISYSLLDKIAALVNRYFKLDQGHNSGKKI